MALPDTLGLVGTTIAEKYALESVVGEGGFAVVYRATHLLWKRPVAVKVFQALGDVPADQRGKLLEEFIREGALLADLSERSAAIVQARDVGMLKTPKGEEVPYMVLEWLEGATLEAVIADEQARGVPPRSVEECIRILEPVGEALALAHGKGIAHRDVKPANVFVLGDPRSPAPTVKLLDFGIAKVVQDAQRMAGSFNKTTGQMTSFTPAYGAPEQFSRSRGATGPWTDVFALALVVVELLTHRPPLDGDDFMQLAFSSSNPAARPTPRKRGATTVSDPVEAVMGRALAVQPEERFATVGEFWSALREAAGLGPSRRLGGPPSGRASQPSTPEVDSYKATVLAEKLPQVMGQAMASTQGEPPVSAGQPPRRSKAPFVALGALFVAAGAAVGYLFVLKPAPPPSEVLPLPTASATASVSAASSSTATPPPPACPTGMIEIPGGEFFMGSDDGPDSEKPAHHVKLTRYCIGQHETTVAEYKECSDHGGCKRAGTINDWDGISEHERKVFDPLCNARDPVNKGTHPINCVDWQMAVDYCQSMIPGGRLPTEAEWEFAARGPDGRKYPWGDDAPSASLLNACGEECVRWGIDNHVDEKAMYPGDDTFPNTAPVGSFPGGRSRYGVDDVVGNVWEWVADWYGPYPTGAEVSEEPKGPSKGASRVVRGGAWNSTDPAWVRPTFRFHDTPGKRSYGTGFRCAK